MRSEEEWVRSDGGGGCIQRPDREGVLYQQKAASGEQDI